MEKFIHVVDRSRACTPYCPETYEQQLIVVDVPLHPEPPRTRRTRAHLAPWQAKLAREMMTSQLAGGLVLNDIAVRLNMTVNHFIKAFGESEGVSPYHWYMQQRLIQAMTLLRDGSLSLSKVAVACGFADQSHFTKTFTRTLGISPGRWRRKQLDPSTSRVG